jgi:hypothetical protein
LIGHLLAKFRKNKNVLHSNLSAIKIHFKMAACLHVFFVRRCREQLPEYADCDIEDELGEESMRLKRVLLG